MNDEFKETLQVLGEWKKELDIAIPALIKEAKQFIISPEVHYLVDISNKARIILPETIKQFAELTAPYAEMAKQFKTNVAPFLAEFAEVSFRLSLIHRFGNVQYVAWESIPEELFDQVYMLSDSRGILEALTEWNARNSYIENTIRLLSENEDLKNNQVFQQAVGAYHRAEYDLASLGFTAMIDRLLSEYSGQITSTSIRNRVKAITEKIKIGGDSALDEVEINDFVLISTYSRAIELFGAASDFEKDEPELNRHWIAHGRMERSMGKIDCIRLVNILYGTVLMNRLAISSDEL